MSDIYSCLCMQLVLCQLTHLEALSRCCIEYLVEQCRLCIISVISFKHTPFCAWWY